MRMKAEPHGNTRKYTNRDKYICISMNYFKKHFYK